MSHIDDIKAKIYDRQDLVNQVGEWRKENLKVVFTNGCFDLLHKGHVDYLSRAADKGDVLIVAVNSDASVSKLKGPHRPIQDQSSRLWVLSSLACISAVTIFGEDTPMELIQLLKPDILVKGGDYTVNTIVGAREVQQNCGKVEIIPFLDGYSTSRLEDKMLRWDDSEHKK
ncbi:MAG: rfaE bifunctional protein nucleotidyltransferase chain/domain [Bacteroidia bacterium]|jgi:rfaE bifunctional protein nucleotidyltransferase chain/domain